jgi:hypothetical protein
VTRDAEQREACDAVQADMAEHQRRFAPGGEVDADHNRQLAATLFERIDRKADEAPRLTSGPSLAAPRETGERDGREYRFVRAPATEQTEKAAAAPRRMLLADPRTLERYEKMQARVNLLLEKRDRGPLGAPSWRERVLSALYWGNLTAAQLRRANLSRADADRCMAAELRAVLDASSATFGDWRTVRTRVVPA